MIINDELKSAVISTLTNAQYFNELALEVFRFQAGNNPIYKDFLKNIRVNPLTVKELTQIPFLPIQFFKYHPIIAGNVAPQFVFESSGTTGQITSKHYINDLPFYEHISRQIFEQFYGSITNFHVLALLPSYLERNNSSLVYMVQNFIFHSNSTESGFYLRNIAELVAKLKFLSEKQADSLNSKKVLLIGVTFALLDLAESGEDLSFLQNFGDNLIIMETGGMKGKRKELLREEVHAILTEKLFVKKIHSEYGMTELLSQGYSKGEGVFEVASSMKILLRDINDPFDVFANSKEQRKKTGGINVIDLANIDSCSFIETQDLGAFQEDNFMVLGRFDNSDVRGCNLMVV